MRDGSRQWRWQCQEFDVYVYKLFFFVDILQLYHPRFYRNALPSKKAQTTATLEPMRIGTTIADES